MKKMISSLEKGVKYTGNNETKRSGKPYLISSSYEINLIANSMERRLGLRYTTLLINCNRQKKGDNAVCRSTFNLTYKRLQPRITKIQKIQQGTKNEGKWKEARYREEIVSAEKKRNEVNKDNSLTHFTFSTLFVFYKSEEVEIRHEQS